MKVSVHIFTCCRKTTPGFQYIIFSMINDKLGKMSICASIKIHYNRISLRVKSIVYRLSVRQRWILCFAEVSELHCVSVWLIRHEGGNACHRIKFCRTLSAIELAWFNRHCYGMLASADDTVQLTVLVSVHLANVAWLANSLLVLVTRRCHRAGLPLPWLLLL